MIDREEKRKEDSCHFLGKESEWKICFVLTERNLEHSTRAESFNKEKREKRREEREEDDKWSLKISSDPTRYLLLPTHSSLETSIDKKGILFNCLSGGGEEEEEQRKKKENAQWVC